ncbi:S8 family peptidase [Paenibacillus sp. sptzw28]|uniref:S8 family peptidase n=1 Tax=Paenibacillus sp. sptzw28 TaxID=715179 RepID=UPI001C6E1F61|nr:S8 family peptidase [Paenibacillus sp. sptzw28]QYR20121.1 S8 family peptidase [Paenibacillus sp. sptzw28]
MRRKLLGWSAVVAAAVFLIPLMPWFGAPDNVNRPADQTRTMSVNQEHVMKMQTVKRDMEATALLCRTECARNFHKLMSKSTAHPTANGAENELSHMMKMHKQMVYVLWKRGGKTLTKGNMPSAESKPLHQHLAAAKASLKTGKAYSSPSFQTGNHRYVIITVPDQRKPGEGIVGILLQDIVAQVEHHQRRNLRVIPYPAEGNYRIESAAPNSTKDITVKSGEDNGNASHYRINEVVVRFQQPPSEADINRMKKDLSAISVRKLGYTYVFRSAKMEAETMMHYFRTSWSPQYVEPHYLYMTNDVTPIIPNDALYSQYQWNLPSIETEKGWNLTKGSDKVLIAVLDTGVQADHPDLKGKLEKGTNIMTEGDAPDDDVGHGTHVAGIIAASVNNGEGVAGLSWYNKILPVKVLDSSGAGSTYSVAQGIIWATDHGAKVINMSLGNYAQAEFLHDAIRYAYDRGVVLVAASGNDNTDRPGYPAAYPEVFAVASTDADGSRSSFSNYGDYIDVAAPGASIASTYPGSQYAALSGTSMASPHVAALAGLIRSINPDLTNVEVMDIMRKSARDLGAAGKDNNFGYGQIDIVKALEMARRSDVSLLRFPEQVKQRLEQIADKYEVNAADGAK